MTIPPPPSLSVQASRHTSLYMRQRAILFKNTTRSCCVCLIIVISPTSRLLPVARMNTPVCNGAADRTANRRRRTLARWAHIRAILHAYMQRFLGIGALRCHAGASCGTKPASKLGATIRWQSAMLSICTRQTHEGIVRRDRTRRHL